MLLRIHPSSGPCQWLVTGAAMGVVAGVTLGLYQMIVAGLSGAGFLAPFATAAALVLGPEALAAAPPPAEVLEIGVGVHLAVAGVCGALFGLAASLVTILRTSRLAVFLVGPVYGAAVWAAGQLLVAPLLVPGLPHEAIPPLAGHVAFFGTVLGALMARRMDRYSLRAELGAAPPRP